jgi:hypothetical protein
VNPANGGKSLMRQRGDSPEASSSSGAVSRVAHLYCRPVLPRAVREWEQRKLIEDPKKRIRWVSARGFYKTEAEYHASFDTPYTSNIKRFKRKDNPTLSVEEGPHGLPHTEGCTPVELSLLQSELEYENAVVAPTPVDTSPRVKLSLLQSELECENAVVAPTPVDTSPRGWTRGCSSSDTIFVRGDIHDGWEEIPATALRECNGECSDDDLIGG